LSLDNRGLIFSVTTGVEDVSAVGGGDRITNSGTIEGTNLGIDVDTEPDPSPS